MGVDATVFRVMYMHGYHNILFMHHSCKSIEDPNLITAAGACSIPNQKPLVTIQSSHSAYHILSTGHSKRTFLHQALFFADSYFLNNCEK